MSEELGLLIQIKADIQTALSAMQKTADATANLGSTSDQASTRVENLQRKIEGNAASTKDLIQGFSGVATSAWALYQGYDRLIDTQVSVDKAMLGAKSSANAAEDAQRRYAATVEKFGPASEQATSALKDLEIAQERASVSQDRATMVTDNLKESYVGFALGVIPASITMIAGLDKTMTGLGLSTTVSSFIAATAGTAWAVLTGKIALTTVATGIMTAAQAALNAVMAINPIFLVVAALAALVIGLKWAYDNVEPFRNAVDALGRILAEKLKPILDMIGGALQRIGDFWGWLTGQTQRANEEQTAAIEQATQAQLADIDKRYSEMEATAESSYKKQVDDAAKKWLDQLNVEATGFDKVVEEYNKHYDKLEDEISSALEKQIRDIESSFKDQESVVKDALSANLDKIKESYRTQIDEIKTQLDIQLSTTEANYGLLIDAAKTSLDDIKETYKNQTESIKEEYRSQLDETTNYYDNLIGIVEGGLSEITGARRKDLDDLELNFLLQKEAADNAYASGQLTKEQYEKTISDLEKTYNATRSAKSQDYRIQELQYEEAHAGELEALQAEKRDAVTKIKAEENTRLAALEDQYLADQKTAAQELEQLQSDLKDALTTIKDEETAKLKAMETQHETDIMTLKQTAAEQIAALEEKRVGEEQIAKAESDAKIVALEAQRKTDINTIRAEMKTMADKFQADLSKLETDKATERNTIVSKAEADKKVIEEKGHAGSLAAMDAYRENARIRNEAMATSLGNIWSGMVSAAQSAWNWILSIFSQSVPAPTYPTPPNPIYPAAPLDGGLDGTVQHEGYPPGATGRTRNYETGEMEWVYGQHGFEGVITKPTPMIVGEAGPEWVSVTPMGRGGGGGGGADRSITFNFTIQGNADEATARLAADLILKTLRKY